ncbi:hypothetical protein RHOSPDRAFT_34656 [Rhodotorula sp. JG-1b]|nr:hypothetical protein RHOSPDRAFT_34656 [Rhodotorula sp. JG-1b]
MAVDVLIGQTNVTSSLATPDPSHDAQNAAPDLVRPVSLPDELWTTIFEQLNFHDLLRVEMVCQRFQNLLKDHQLASILFRAGPQEPIKKGQKLDLHPMLDIVERFSHSGKCDKAMLPLKMKQEKEKKTKKNKK